MNKLQDINYSRFAGGLITSEQLVELTKFNKGIKSFDTLMTGTQALINEIEDFYRAEMNTEDVDEESTDFKIYFNNVIAQCYEVK